jgi:hypothetical protein
MIRVLLAMCGALVLASIGAFFLFVPLLSIATVICLVAGMLLMFGLGFQMGPQGMLPQRVGTGPVEMGGAGPKV